MTRAARSVYVFGIYLLVVGAVLVGAPNVLLALLQLPPTNEPWIHVVGVPVIGMGVYHVVAARTELVPFFRATVWLRVFVLAIFAAMAALQVVPPIIIGFGLVDAGCALWTHIAMRETRVQLAAP